MSSSLQEELARNQRESRHYIVYEWCNGDHGIGSEFHMMVPSLSMAYHLGRAFIVRGRWIFAGNHQNDDGFTYWFRPLVEPTSGGHIKTSTVNNNDNNIIVDAMTSYTTVNERYGGPPDKYADRGITWWKGQLLRFLMQPNQRLQQAIDKAIKVPQPFIGLQVRHSSNWTSRTRRNIPLADYMKYVEQIRRKTGINTVFVSTEDQKVIDQCTKDYPDYRFYWTRGHHRSNQNQAKAIIAGKLDGVEEGRIGLVNLFLMREASHFVGGFQSNWGRLILEHIKSSSNVDDVFHCYSLERIPIERYRSGSMKAQEFQEYNRYFCGGDDDDKK
jgi:hypothetical protein